MADLILGLGEAKDLAEIVATSEKEIATNFGPARRLLLVSKVAELVITRPVATEWFQSFSMRLKSDGIGTDEIANGLSAFSGKFVLESDNGRSVITYPTDGQTGVAEECQALLNECGVLVGLPEVWHVDGDHYEQQGLTVTQLFRLMTERKASDVHLDTNHPPILRIDNDLVITDCCGPLTSEEIESMLHDIAPQKAWEQFQQDMQTSFGFHQVGMGYSRISAFRKHGSVHLTFRYLPEQIPSFEQLSLPSDTLREMADMHRGLFLITGMTGSGKTTTLAAMVDYINRTRKEHILSIEHPIEFVHESKSCIVSQRDTGADVPDFFMGVTAALRHDPDVIVIGEMRDKDTIRSAINAAATGHLVLSTLHSNTAAEVVNRIISFFDPIERDLVRLQLRDCLKGVICQRLLPKLGGGRLPAIEMMFNDLKQINDCVLMGDTDGIHVGMQQTTTSSFIFEKYLYGMIKRKDITVEDGRDFSTDVSMLDQMLIGTYSVPRVEGLKRDGLLR